MSAESAEPAGGRVVCFATQGHEHIEGYRIRGLLERLDPEAFPFERAHKRRSALGLLRVARRERPDLFVMEGTGMAGGIPLMLIGTFLGIPYVVCQGDAVGPYLGLRSRLAGMLGGIYERALCRRCAGFVGWTPYLAGRGMTYGAPRAMTAAGWTRSEPSPGAREAVRARLGISSDTIVVGLTGSIQHSPRRGYVYGSELVEALLRTSRSDLAVMIVGDGSGLERLRERAGEELGSRVFLTGRVTPEEVPDHLVACDLASLSQSTDAVGGFRYTTKLSEYVAAGLPVVSGETPLAYDLDEGFIWRLPGFAPWSPEYVDALAELLGGLEREDLERRREAVAARRCDPFDKAAQQERMRAFVTDILAARARD